MFHTEFFNFVVLRQEFDEFPETLKGNENIIAPFTIGEI